MDKEKTPVSEQNEMELSQQKVVIVMGSESDKDHAYKITKLLEEFGVKFDLRVGSAHKTPHHVLSMISEYEVEESGREESDLPHGQLVFIAVAGRSNALGGFIDANCSFPVINSPPKGESQTIFSSLEMPSGVASTTVLYPESAALAAVKIFALSNPELQQKLLEYQERQRQRVLTADGKLRYRPE